MRIDIEVAGRLTLARRLERAALRRLERGGTERLREPARPPERADLRPWPAPGERDGER